MRPGIWWMRRVVVSPLPHRQQLLHKIPFRVNNPSIPMWHDPSRRSGKPTFGPSLQVGVRAVGQLVPERIHGEHSLTDDADALERYIEPC